MDNTSRKKNFKIQSIIFWIEILILESTIIILEFKYQFLDEIIFLNLKLKFKFK
jgi:hypothetical protein